MAQVIKFDDDESSGMTAEERHQEAVRILKLFIQCQIGDQFTDQERTFVTQQMFGSKTSWGQLKWLRDLKDKYIS